VMLDHLPRKLARRRPNDDILLPRMAIFIQYLTILPVSTETATTQIKSFVWW